MGRTKKTASGIIVPDNEIVCSIPRPELSPVRNTSHKYLKFINTDLFNEAARHFLKYKTYTLAPPGTRAYDEYWDTEEVRCLTGYTVGGVRITGEHYAYLNYSQIKATTFENGRERKRLTFPQFLDMDYYYYHELETAELEGQGMIVAKSRRKGFSYKNAFGCVWKQKFFRESLSIIGAYLSDYSDATMAMALEMANFLNTNTDWARRRLIDKKEHIKDGYKETTEDGISVEKGFKSEIMTMTFKDNPSKSIGKTADRMLFEEAGKWPRLIDSYRLSAPLFKDGETIIGTPLIFGTGGDMENGTADFSDMFYNPKSYQLRAYQNIYDENAVGECGWFVDEMWYRRPHVDNDGNSDRKSAGESVDSERNIVKNGKSKRSYEKFVTQAPKTPREAFLRTTGNVFPTVSLNEHLAYIETHEEAKYLGQTGKFIRDKTGKAIWSFDSSLIPAEYPTKEGEEEGCIVIFEHPPIDAMYSGLYTAGIDPYDHDKSQTGSLGSCIIYKRFSSFGSTYHWPVAEYTGRPERAEEFYENCRKLLEYYCATALYENEKINILTYFRTKHSDYLLADQPSIINKMVKNSSVQRGKGIHMNKVIKDAGEIRLRDWLNEEYEPGKKNLTKIYSIPLLKELIAYNDEGNFDRVMAFMMVMFMNDELHNQIDAEKQEDLSTLDNFFTRDHFRRRR